MTPAKPGGPDDAPGQGSSAHTLSEPGPRLDPVASPPQEDVTAAAAGQGRAQGFAAAMSLLCTELVPAAPPPAANAGMGECKSPVFPDAQELLIFLPHGTNILHNHTSLNACDNS